ncbi:uncharacterized protein Z518_08349 [Rhinocladiella mackenziei CBS 650.93]|uniref:Uncharacterized protein n=1 Tax=Rhinocladiella mackenziei CBS 650.93 TaxID=1442369 RepID=A0A0D2GVX8_9EURO|nr:uncharacterized protein Z518_08349 [Rhinocladiella mackenziei CBS 650.93]KIX02408.1 hypothetical protein Z518_08349 [Rhinocladiella mackenziei CBS 650.93]
MAPNFTSNRPTKKAYSRMVQPALPLIPGSKPKKSTVVEQPAKAQEPDPNPAIPNATNGEKVETKTYSPSDPSPSDASQYGSPADKEVPSPTDSHPVTPSVSSTPTPQELPAEFSADNSNSEKETIPAKEQNYRVTEPSKSEVRNNDLKDGEEAVTSANGQYPESFEESNVVVGQEQQEQAPGRPTLAVRTENAGEQGVANGISQSKPTENDGFNQQQEQHHHGDPLACAPDSTRAVPAQSLNGFHQPVPAGASKPTTLPAPIPRPFNTLSPLNEHLLYLSTSKQGWDWVIFVNPPNGPQFYTFAHYVVISRSPRLQMLTTRQNSPNQSANTLTLYPPRPVIPHAFEAALRFLYSDTVLAQDFFAQPHPAADVQATRLQNFDYIMSYWVSGIELGVEQIAGCAERLLSRYLDWDILEITYKNAMDLATSPISSVGRNMTGSDYPVASSSMIKMVLQFLAKNIDVGGFKLDTISESNLLSPRLPHVDEGRPKHNPALAAMVFGSMPSSADMSPSSPQSEILPTASTFKDTVASNILLNADFESLNLFNNLLNAHQNLKSSTLMADVVRERETRRQKVWGARSVSNRDRMANSAMWEPVGLKELLNDHVLSRERVGFLLSSK